MRKNDLKVGVFVLFGLVLAGLVIFLLGDTRRLFDERVKYKLAFDDVAGLKKGAPVQMGGVLVGQVDTVAYGEDPKDARIYVTIEVVSDAANRLRPDSVAKIVNKGFLGDKMLDITKGDKGDPLKAGTVIPSEEPEDFMKALGDIGGSAKSAMGDVQRVAQSLADEKLHRDLRSTVSRLDKLLAQVTDGEGYPARFLSDKQEAERISSAVESLDKSAAELAATLREARMVAQQVRTGPGFLHDIIYGDGPQKEIAQIGGAADEIGLTLKGIREGDGFARDVLFGAKDKSRGGEALANVNAITGDLRDIVRGLKQGKGTLGALLVDPSVYEDVKRLLGNVQRNAVLRSLVRYSIKQNESGDAPKTMDVGAAP